MKTLLFAILLLVSVISSDAERPITGPIIARVDWSFSYGMDVTWYRNPILLKYASVICIEYNGVERLAHAGPYKVSGDKVRGIVYVFDFDVRDVPVGAVIRVVK